MLASWFEKSSLIGWSLKGRTAEEPIDQSFLHSTQAQYAPLGPSECSRGGRGLAEDDADSLSDSSSDISSRLSGYDPSTSSGSDFEYFTGMSSQSDQEGRLGGSFSSLSDIDQDPRSLSSKPSLDSDLEYITAASYASFSEYETSSVKSGSSYYTAVSHGTGSRPTSWGSDFEYETARSHLSTTSGSEVDSEREEITPTFTSRRNLEFRFPPVSHGASTTNNNNNSNSHAGYQYGCSGYADSDLTPNADRYKRPVITQNSDLEYSTAVSDLSDLEDGSKRKWSVLRTKPLASGNVNTVDKFHKNVPRLLFLARNV